MGWLIVAWICVFSDAHDEHQNCEKRRCRARPVRDQHFPGTPRAGDQQWFEVTAEGVAHNQGTRDWDQQQKGMLLLWLCLKVVCLFLIILVQKACFTSLLQIWKIYIHEAVIFLVVAWKIKILMLILYFEVFLWNAMYFDNIFNLCSEFLHLFSSVD